MSNLKKQGTGPTVATAMELLLRPLRTKKDVDALEVLTAANPEDWAALVRSII